MKIYRHLFGFLAALAIGVHAPAFSAPEKKAWITMGDAAFRQVRRLVPGLASIESRQLVAEEQTVHAVNSD